MGGEENDEQQNRLRRQGLPPRGRGRVPMRLECKSVRRITPAWAGKRQPKPSGVTADRDYPRVGGEERLHFAALLQARGLPPRGRGRERSYVALRPPYRITPAWAGKRQRAMSATRSSRDYPRVGGEERAGGFDIVLASGLPPRGRGREEPGQLWRGGPGITPAWAGKRMIPSGTPRMPRDYPRVGGEECGLFSGLRRPIGLPPRGRGRDFGAAYPA